MKMPMRLRRCSWKPALAPKSASQSGGTSASRSTAPSPPAHLRTLAAPARATPPADGEGTVVLRVSIAGTPLRDDTSYSAGRLDAAQHRLAKQPLWAEEQDQHEPTTNQC